MNYINYSAVPNISYLCDDCGTIIDLIKFTVEKGQPDHNGARITSIRTDVCQIVEHMCGGKAV